MVSIRSGVWWFPSDLGWTNRQAAPVATPGPTGHHNTQRKDRRTAPEEDGPSTYRNNIRKTFLWTSVQLPLGGPSRGPP